MNLQKILHWLSALRSWLLLGVLVTLVCLVMGLLIWFSVRNEINQVQQQLDGELAQVQREVRAGLSRNVFLLQTLSTHDWKNWSQQALAVLQERQEMLHIEQRDINLQLQKMVRSPHYADFKVAKASERDLAGLAQTCALASRYEGVAYSSTYYIPQSSEGGVEVIELCMPLVEKGQTVGYQVVLYSLPNILRYLAGTLISRNQELSFTDADGARLAQLGRAQALVRLFSARQLFNLPGVSLVLRMDGWYGVTRISFNIFTTLIGLMSLALIAVFALLVKDNRRRLKAEQDLADAFAFRKAMENSLITGLRACDLQGRITYVNPVFCDMVGFTEKELQSEQLPATYWPPEFMEQSRQRKISNLGEYSATSGGFETTFVHKDGRSFPVLVMEAPLMNAAGKQVGWMSAFLDISEKHRAEEQSRTQLDRLQATARLAMVGEMASLLSHELNQPLAVISSYAVGTLNLLRQPAPPLNEIEQVVERIAQQAERAGRVIKSVHDFVRRRDQTREFVAPQALLDAIMPLVTMLAKKTGVRIRLFLEDNLPDVFCDRTMVEQVLLNLARNAIQAMNQSEPSNAELGIQIRLFEQDQDWIEFRVIDQGIGISSEVKSRLFTPFFTTKINGMGLGLSFCRTVIEQHGGVFSFIPNSPQGTIFKFTLPWKKAI